MNSGYFYLWVCCHYSRLPFYQTSSSPNSYILHAISGIQWLVFCRFVIRSRNFYFLPGSHLGSEQRCFSTHPPQKKNMFPHFQPGTLKRIFCLHKKHSKRLFKQSFCLIEFFNFRFLRIFFLYIWQRPANIGVPWGMLT